MKWVDSLVREGLMHDFEHSLDVIDKQAMTRMESVDQVVELGRAQGMREAVRMLRLMVTAEEREARAHETHKQQVRGR